MNIRLLPFILSFYAFYAHAGEYEFSSAMLKASGLSDVAALSGDESFYKPGKYEVSVYVNNKFFSKKTLDFEMKSEGLMPLFTGNFIRSLPLKKKT